MHTMNVIIVYRLMLFIFLLELLSKEFILFYYFVKFPSIHSFLIFRYAVWAPVSSHQNRIGSHSESVPELTFPFQLCVQVSFCHCFGQTFSSSEFCSFPHVFNIQFGQRFVFIISVIKDYCIVAWTGDVVVFPGRYLLPFFP